MPAEQNIFLLNILMEYLNLFKDFLVLIILFLSHTKPQPLEALFLKKVLLSALAVD
jgi:hypothetical protein